MLHLKKTIRFFSAIVFLFDVFFLFDLFFSGLDTDCEDVKRQVFELLSALCLYSTKGFHRALELLTQYKVRSPCCKCFIVVLKENPFYRENQTFRILVETPSILFSTLGI